MPQPVPIAIIVRMNSTPTYDLPQRDLCSRSSDGIDVALLWSPGADHAHVAVVDTKLNQTFQFSVGASEALRAFDHPFAYAADRGLLEDVATIAPSCHASLERVVDR